MQRKVPWNLVWFAVTVVVSVVLLWGGNHYATRHAQMFTADNRSEILVAKVEHIWTRIDQEFELDNRTMTRTVIYFDATVTSGARQGARISAKQINDPFSPVQMRDVGVGDRITMVQYEQGDDEVVWVLQDYVRTRPIAVLAVVFAAMLLLFGGRKGVTTIISLVFTCLSIFLVFIPLLLSGHNIYLATCLICIYIVVMTLVLVNGVNLKSLSACVGCIGGILVAGGLVLLMSNVLKLTGLVDEDSAFLLYMDTPNPIDLKAIIFSGILIGALGAMLDVAVSMAASLSELHATSPGLGFSKLLRSGFNIGRDILGTMTNTLVLAYIGGSLSISLLLIAYSNSLMELLNRELIVVEILQALIGSIGLVFAIPLTSVFAAYVFTRGKKTAIVEGPEEAVEKGLADPLTDPE